MRRHLSPGRDTITRIFGCYVNEARKIIATFDEPVALMGEDEHEQYLSILKKLLSGRLNQNLIDIGFSMTQVAGEGDEHALLMKLRKDCLLDEAGRRMFYDKVIQTVDLTMRCAFFGTIGLDSSWLSLEESRQNTVNLMFS